MGAVGKRAKFSTGDSSTMFDTNRRRSQGKNNNNELEESQSQEVIR
jgi:hypothetical protein